MKNFAKYFLVICLAGLALLLTQNIVLPFIYRIKEPYFVMPIKAEEEVTRPEDLPIRSDDYGEGQFGAKRKGNRRHTGLDLRVELKSPVYASKSGWGRAYLVPTGYGNLVVINHPGGHETRYGHLDKTTIKRTRWVRQGQIIGSVGKSGNADVKGIDPHLHFEIRHKGKPVDPEKELLRRK